MITRAQDERPHPRPDRRRRGALLLFLLVSGVASLAGGPAAALLVAFGLFGAWLLVPAVARFAAGLGATVLPGGRAIHAERTPLLGGLAIFVPVCIYLVARGDAGSLGLAAGAALVVAAGVVDDLRGTTPRFKIAMQVAAAFTLVATGTGAHALALPPAGTLATNGFETLVVVCWVVVATNAFNLIDGLDGLAASAALVGAMACGLLGLGGGAAFVLAGAAVGFLRFNLPRARVFLGDTGSLLLGFLVAAFVLGGGGPVNVPLALGLLALPLGDAALSAVRRWLRGKPIFSADRGHVHHLLLNVWDGKARRVLAGLACFSIAQAVLIASTPDLFGLLGVGGLWLALVAYLLKRGTPRWTSMLLHRRAFRRLHVARRYAHDALRLAECTGDVRSVLERVVDDFRLAAVRLRGLRVDRPGNGAVLVEEHVDCGDSEALWAGPLRDEDPVLAEEQRTVLCDLLRHADDRLAELGAPPSPARTAPATHGFRLTGAGATLLREGRARMHCIAEGRDGLAGIAEFVRRTRSEGRFEPVVVHTGRRDDLDGVDVDPAAIDLDVPSDGGLARLARVIERYDALLDVQRPEAVVAGDSPAGVACALLARERGIEVVRLDGLGTGPGLHDRDLARVFAEALAPKAFGERAAGEPAAERGTRVLPRLDLIEERPGWTAAGEPREASEG